MDVQEVKKVSSKARAFSVGKRRIPADEFAAAAASEFLQVDLNSATLEQLEQASKKRFPAFKLEDCLDEFEMTESTVCMSTVETRAVLLLRLITFLQGRACVRPQVAEFLGEALTRNVLPRLPSLAVATDKQVMTVLVNAIRLDGEYKTRLAAENIPVPELNGNEIHKFTLGITPSQAVFILASASARTLTKLNDAYAGLSLEVISAFSEPFQSTYYENAHAYTSAVEVASTLRWLNEGSTLVNKSNRKVADQACFRYIPVVNGAFRDATQASTLVSRVDLNSAEAAGHINDWQHNPALARNYLEQSSKTLIHASNELISASTARLQFVLSNIAELGPLNVDTEVAKKEEEYLTTELHDIKTTQEVFSSDDMDVVASMAQLISTANRAIQLEGFVSSQILKARDVTVQEAAVAAQETKRIALEQRVAKLLAEGKTELAETMKQRQSKKDTGAAVKGLVIGYGATIINAALPTDARTTVSQLLATHKDLLYNNNFLEGLSRSVTPVNQTFMPKLPKGTRDSNPQLMAVREKAFDIITKVFQKHGGVGIDTPVFERRETLMGKYGEDSKLIYDLADQGGEILSLRYDLTVPFARFCATNGVTNIKRYHIAKVYRRDNPVMNKGRFREFFQCDYDVAGQYPPMIADAEVIKVMCDILSSLDLGAFKIKLSHRKLLDGVLTIAGVPADKLRPICSAVDKLDKEPWSVVKDEMCLEKGLPEAIADRLEKYVTIPPGEPFTLLALLKEDAGLAGNASALEAFDELTLLFQYLQSMNALQHISFDMSLARGLDYYTGVIYEAVLLDPAVAVGSIGAGGRYDNLVGMFSGRNVPAVGVSIGLERIMAILEKRELEKFGFIKAAKTQVLVASVGNNLIRERMVVAAELWAQDIPAEFLYLENPNIRKQMEFAFDNNIPLVAWIGEDELKNGVVSVKTLSSNKDDQTEAVTVPRAELAQYITNALA